MFSVLISVDNPTIEKETIALFNEGEDTAEIYTFNKKLISKIRNKCEQHPDIFRITKEDNHGGVTCQLPKKRLSVVLTSPPTLENSLASSQRAKERNALGLNLAVDDGVL